MESRNQIDNLADLAHDSDRWTESERTAIVNETNRILADPAFRGSKRCQALLRRLVENAVNGDQHGVKERTLGIEVFGREPNYDTAADPVVRTTANEIRKRLAQSYQEPDRHQVVKIRLFPGAYLPQFEFVHQQSPPEAEVTKSAEATLEVTEPHPAGSEIEKPSTAASSASSRSKWIWVAVAILVSLSITLAAIRFESIHSKDYLVWKPLLDSSQPLTLCISDAVVAVGDVTIGSETKPNPNTSMTDAEDAEKITTWLVMHGQQTNLRGSSTVNLRDLRQGPMVLIGAFNPWSQMMLSGLRYSAHTDSATRIEWIQDAHDPSNRQWQINMDHVDIDYAIVTRYSDPETGKWILELGGLRPYGTQAAGDLLTDRSLISLLPDALGSKGNFQIVLKTSVIDGSAGRPQVLAFYSW